MSATGPDQRDEGTQSGVATLFRDQQVNAGLFWAFIAGLVAVTVGAVVAGDLLSATFTAGVVTLAVLVPVAYRSPLVTLPWELLAVASVSTVGRALVPGTAGVIATYAAVAAVALMLAVGLHAFAPGVSMSNEFAAVFVVVVTLAAAGTWALVRWLGGLYLGTTPLTELNTLMWEFVGSTAVGGVAGVTVRTYTGRRAYAGRLPVVESHADRQRELDRPGEDLEDGEPESIGTPEGSESRLPRLFRGRLRDRIGITAGQQAAAARLMEYVLVGLLFVGIERQAVGIVVNAGVAILVVQLPPVLERNHKIPMDPAVTLWITAAAFLHALGTVGIPGTGATFYRTVWWYDHLTHALSASVVAAVGYATVRAVDRHSDSVSLSPRFVFVFILSFVLAFGVLWEVLEFGLGGLGDVTGGQGQVLTQYGLTDTMRDLLFNLAGGVVAATWGTAYLADVTGALADRLDRRGRGESE